MEERFEIESLEQLRAISDELRLRVIALLQERPMTVTQVAEILGMTSARVHYHVRELEKVGLLHLVETREKGGILEKYYQPVAREIVASRTLLLSFPPDKVISTVDFWFDRIKGNFVRSLSQKIEQEDEHAHAAFGVSQLYLTPEEYESLNKQIEDLLAPYKEPHDRKEEQVVLSTQIMSSLHVPLFALPAEEAAEVASPTLPSEDSSPRLAPTGPLHRSINVSVMGVKNFTRADLEGALNSGCYLHINVVGVCRFSDDVSTDLVSRAVKHFSLIGKLVAPQAVREMLQHK